MNRLKRLNRLHFTAALATSALVAAALAPRLFATPAAASPAEAIHAPAQAQPIPVQQQQPQVVVQEDRQAALVEGVFVLDTTGSMGGLIDGAKETIWSTVDTFVSQTPQPEIRVGIVAYRDRGDAYVTKDMPLTDDLDEVYGFLMALQADGGGDTPEAVNQALWTATNSMKWTTDRHKTFRSIFLVGDAPPKAYPDEATHGQIVTIARERGIFVNAIQCGVATDTRSIFSKIAGLGSGTFTQVAGSGGVARLDAPMDGDIARLERELEATALPYGEDGVALERKVATSAGASLSSRASRRSVLNKLGSGVATGGGDLVGDIASGKVAIDEVPEAEVPAAWKDLTIAERMADNADRLARRAELTGRIDALTHDRDVWVAKEREARAATGHRGYDDEVNDATVEALKHLGYVD